MLLSGAAFKALVHSGAPSLVPFEALLLYSGEFHIPRLEGAAEGPAGAAAAGTGGGEMGGSGAEAGVGAKAGPGVKADPWAASESALCGLGGSSLPALPTTSPSASVSHHWWWWPMAGWLPRKGGPAPPAGDTTAATATQMDVAAGPRAASLASSSSGRCSGAGMAAAVTDAATAPATAAAPATGTTLSSLFQVSLLLPLPQCYCCCHSHAAEHHDVSPHQLT